MDTIDQFNIPTKIEELPQFQIGSLLLRATNNPNDAPDAQQLWMYAPIPQVILGTLEVIDQLTARGWREVPTIYQMLLHTQLHETIAVESLSRKTWSLWTHQDSAACVEEYPVALVSEIDLDQTKVQEGASPLESVPSLPLLTPLPLPTAGMGGIIMDISNADAPLVGYRIQMLSTEAQNHLEQLSLLLREMMGDERWMRQEPIHHMALNPVECQREINHLITYIQLTHGETQRKVRKQIADLRQALLDVRQVVEMQQRPSYESNMKEVRQHMKTLAQDYYKYHLLSQQKLPPAEDIFPNGEALAATCQTMQTVTLALQNAASKGADQWGFKKGYPPYYRKGNNVIEYRDKGNESVAITDDSSNALWEQVKNQQTDTQIDLAFAAISLCIRSQEPDHSAWIYTEKFLDSRGLAKKTTQIVENGRMVATRTAGHHEEEQKKVERALFSLENIWIQISQQIEAEETGSKSKKWKRREFTYKGRLFIVKGSLTQKDLGTTANDSGRGVAWHIAPGDWLNPFLESPNRQVANLSERALQYDPYRQKWEKYLSRYFFFNGHMNSKGRGCVFNRHLGRLLEECSLDIDTRNPQRTRDHFENAMNQLVTDGFINSWYYTVQVRLPRNKWIELWLGQMITIHIAPQQDTRELPLS